MALLDCYYHLNRQSQLSDSQMCQVRPALDYVECHLRTWQNELLEPNGSTFSLPGDVSYALDLMIRWGRVQVEDSESVRIVPLLLDEIDRLEREQAISANLLYCVIQLANHFKGERRIAERLGRISRKIRVFYDSPQVYDQPEVIHPLVLRCLLAIHGETLRAKMMGNLLQGHLLKLQEDSRNNNQEMQEAFQEIIKRRLEVDIREMRPLSGGITKDEVFRVDYVINLTSPYQLGDHARIQSPGPQTIVIKQGSRHSLNRTVHSYHALPNAVKDLFARHADAPQLLATDPTTPAYLILEDLTEEYDTFRNLLNQADYRRLTRQQSQRLHHACNTIMDGLFRIYESTKWRHGSFLNHQLSRIYLSPMEHHANQITQGGKHPHLSQWIGGFWLGQRRFPSLDHYLNTIEAYRSKIPIPCLMLIHGDCHARNIMLDGDCDRMKLIDLDRLDYGGDYIWDVAELIEDVAVFRFLFDTEFRHYHDRRTVRFPASDPLHREAIELRIEYDAISSTLTLEFQRHLMELVKGYAAKTGDTSWQPRLWLALATHLLSLVNNHKDAEHASVLYVEAIKLLDDLCAFLKSDLPLPVIPFPETHSDPSARERRKPFARRDQKTLLELHQAIIAISDRITFEVHSNGAHVRYLQEGTSWPVVLIDATRRPWRMLLATTVDRLTDPEGLTMPTKGAGALGAVALIDKESHPDSLAALVQQMLEASQ